MLVSAKMRALILYAFFVASRGRWLTYLRKLSMDYEDVFVNVENGRVGFIAPIGSSQVGKKKNKARLLKQNLCTVMEINMYDLMRLDWEES